MSVQDGPTSKRYATNGVTTIFAIPFLLLDAADLQVTFNGTVITSGFTVTGVGNPSSTITFTTAPAALGDLLLDLVIPFQRLIDYQENGDFLSKTVNRDFDRIWQALKQLLRYSGRALTLGAFDVDGSGYYQAKGNGIANLRDPVNPQDAATKSWTAQLLDTFTSAVNNTVGIIYDSGSLFDYLRFGVARSVDSIAALRQLSATRNQRAFVFGYYNKGDGGGGEYFVDTADTTSADNGGSIIVAIDGARWKLNHNGSVTIQQFGARMDGSDDSSFVQAALTYIGTVSGGEVVVPEGNCNLGTTGVTMPAVNMTLRGFGRASRLYGSGVFVVSYPTAIVDGGGNFVTQDVTGLCIDQTASGIGLRCHQTWTSAAKIGPRITDNFFINSSLTTTNAKSLSLSGVWAGMVLGNQFTGKGIGGGPTSGIGGYGMFFAIGAADTTCVMNLAVGFNIFTTIAYPIWVPDRTGVGRVEGLKIFGNNLVAGSIGIRTSQTLATTITANQISDFNIGEISTGDFDISIIGNSEITGNSSGLNIIAASFGIAERITILGNNFGTAANGVCLRITNSVGSDMIRSLSLMGNTCNGANLAGTTGIGIQGSFRIQGITISGNILSGLVDGINLGAPLHLGIKLDGNSYYSVTNRVVDANGLALQGRRIFAKTYTMTLVGGTATETVNVAVPAGFFTDIPVSATLFGIGDLLTGYYNYDASSVTQLVFTVRGAAGGVLAAGTRRLCVAANAIDY